MYFINIDLSRTFAIILLREASDDAPFIFFDSLFVNSLIEVLAALVLGDVSTQCPRRKCDGSSTNEKEERKQERKSENKKKSHGGKGNGGGERDQEEVR